METLFSSTLACLYIFCHICVAVSALILHLPRTFSYNGIDSYMTQQHMSYYFWLLVSGGSSDSDFGLSRSHRPIIDLIIILNGVSIRINY